MKDNLSLFNALAYSNLYIALCAVALTAFTLQLLNHPIEGDFLAFVFFSTLFAYNFQRKISLLSEKEPVNSEQNQWMLGHATISNALIIFSFIACFYFLYQIPQESLLLIAPLATISLLYVLRLGNWPALRNVPFLKVFVVAFVWGGTTVLLPGICYDSIFALFDVKNQLLGFSIAFFIFGQSLPFDIRDIRQDQKAKLTTIPGRIGVKKTLLICSISLLVSFLLFFIAYLNHFIRGEELLSISISLFFTLGVLYFTKTKKHPLYYSLLLESCLWLPAFCLFAFYAF